MIIFKSGTSSNSVLLETVFGIPKPLLENAPTCVCYRHSFMTSALLENDYGFAVFLGAACVGE